MPTSRHFLHREFVCSVFCLLAVNGVLGQVAVATAPSYAPVVKECPSNQPLIRLAGTAAHSNQTLSPEEVEYRKGRKAATFSAWKEFFTLGPGAATGYQSTSLVSDSQTDWPTLAVAHSGGGERAALFGAGVLHALDGRTATSPVRGILQLATYHVGLSGGSWLVTSCATNNYAPLDQLVAGWQLERDILFPGGLNPVRQSRYLDDLFDESQLKKDAGFNISLTDPWGRAISRHFLPGTDAKNFFEDSPATAHGAGILFSALRNLDGLKKFQTPFPIVVANNLPPSSSRTNSDSVPIQGQTYTPLSTTVYEITPVELGSFDPYLSAFTPTQYLGTRLSSGKPTGSCTTAFDQASFVMGTSATLFNAILSGGIAEADSTLVTLLKSIQSKITGGLEETNTARYPNPFRGVNGPSGFDSTNLDHLALVDGGENGENVPFNPLLAPARQVDVILAADASADSDGSYKFGAQWPLGFSVMNTFTRVTKILPEGAATFPPVPVDPQVWVDKGFSTRPTLFGCDSPRQEGNGGYPLVVYLPNTPLPQSGAHTNTSTFKLKYSKQESAAFLRSASEAVTKSVLGSKQDAEWPTCLACAIVDRARNRMKVPRSRVCEACFVRYCYNEGRKS